MSYCKRIPNINNLILQNSRSATGANFKLSNRFFYVQRKIISDLYPPFQNNNAFKVYLYLCKHCNGENGHVWLSKTQIANALKISVRPQVDQALGWLEQNHFIECTNTKSGQRYQAKILAAPDYLPETQMFYKYSDIVRDTYELKYHKCGFIILPYLALSNTMLNQSLTRSRWSERKLRIFLLMYQYNWLNYYGGINPDIMHITPNGELKLDLGFCYDVQSDPHKTSLTIQSFISQRLFKPVNCIFRMTDGELVYIGDEGQVPRQQQDIVKTILRPYILLDQQVHELDNTLSKGAFIL
ncbi:hypothetical protein ACEF06_17180 [Brevibacillus agri]